MCLSLTRRWRIWHKARPRPSWKWLIIFGAWRSLQPQHIYRSPQQHLSTIDISVAYLVMSKSPKSEICKTLHFYTFPDASHMSSQKFSKLLTYLDISQRVANARKSAYLAYLGIDGWTMYHLVSVYVMQTVFTPSSVASQQILMQTTADIVTLLSKVNREISLLYLRPCVWNK